MNNDVILPGCHSNQDNAEQFVVQFESVYYKYSEDSAMVDDFLMYICQQRNTVKKKLKKLYENIVRKKLLTCMRR